MDLIGRKQARRSKKSAADFKVVYISSPMKVKTSASKFRSLVQKLTGQDSDAERFMELIGAADVGNRNFQSSAFLDYHDDLIDHRDLNRRLVAGEMDTASYPSAVAPSAEDLVLQNFDANFSEMFHGFLHESSAQTHLMPGFSAAE